MQIALLVGVGGFIGTVARYYCVWFVQSHSTLAGLGTLTVNFLGSLIIGFIYAWGHAKMGSSTILFLTVGVLGGFTTFSAFSVEALMFIKNDKLLFAAGYIFSMLFLCLFATAIGYLLGTLTAK